MDVLHELQATRLSLFDALSAVDSLIAEQERREEQAAEAKEWQPSGGDFFVGAGGSVSMYDSRAFTKEFGMERQTREQAERAAVEMRRFNRLLALRDELCGDDVVDLYSDSKKYCLFYVDKEWQHTDTSVTVLTPYFTSKESAQLACNMLNSGYFKL